jgi:SPOR domain
LSYNLGPIDRDRRTEFLADLPGEEEPVPRSHRVLGVTLALFVMALFAGGLWFAYVQGTRHPGTNPATGDVPLIRADEHPTKVKPERPGGLEVPDRDNLIYSPPRPVVEHLLPPPEKPLPRPTAPPAQAASAAPPQPPAVAPPSQVPPAAMNQPQQLAAAPSGAVAPGAPAPSKPSAGQMPAKAGGARLQLGSVRSEEAARQEWERIKRKNPDILGNLSAAPIRADLGDKGIYYRIQTAPVTDPAAAERLCNQLKQRDIGCIIAR